MAEQDLGIEALADGAPQTDNSDDEFVLARILFLCTYETNVDFDKLVRVHQVADSINSVGHIPVLLR